MRACSYTAKNTLANVILTKEKKLKKNREMEFYSLIYYFTAYLQCNVCVVSNSKMSSDYLKLLDPGSSSYRRTLQGSRFRPFDCSTLCLWDQAGLGNKFRPDMNQNVPDFKWTFLTL